MCQRYTTIRFMFQHIHKLASFFVSPKWLLGSLLFVVCQLNAQVQINLKPQRPNVRPSGYFIIEVADNRPTTANIGKIWARPEPLTATMPGGAARAFENFLGRYFNPAQTDTLTPVILVIRELKVTESLTPANRVNGEIKMSLGFETYRDGKRVLLTSANAASTYTRAGVPPETLVENMLYKLLENQLKGFNDWFQKSAKNTDVLAKRVQLILEQDSISNAVDTLFYDSKRPLNWKDFLGAPSVLSRWAAQIFTSFGFEARSITRNRVVELHVRTKTWMDRTISWVRAESKNDYVLDHEQLHFDITRLAVERFRRHLRTMTFSVEDFSSEIQYQYLEYYRLQTQLQQQYDEETSHGLNRPKQAEWVKKVRDELRTYGIKPPRD